MTSESYDLPPPLDTFQIEKQKGEYKEFSPNDDYPLKGVTYPVSYGDIEGYIAEDGANLDFFVGSTQNGLCGYIKVYRPELLNGERKFYYNLSDSEEAAVLDEFGPVILEAARYSTFGELVDAIRIYKMDSVD